MTPWFAGMVLIPILVTLMLLDGIITHVGLSLGGIAELNSVMGLFYGWNLWLGDVAKVVGSAVVVGAIAMAFRRASPAVAWGLVFGLSGGVGVYSAVVAWNINVLVLRLV